MLCVVCFFPKATFAEEFSYPELQVTPRASDRIDLESKDEFSRRWITHAPSMLSAVSTVFAAAIHSKKADVTNDARYAGLGIGASWIGINVLLALHYTPYKDAKNELSKLPSRTTRDQLTKERIAEEAINSTASFGTKLKWLSFLTNAGACVFMGAYSVNKSFSQTAAFVAAGFSIAPILFPYNWNKVANEHRAYKKKIYGPVASTGAFAEPGTGKFVPGLSLAFSF